MNLELKNKIVDYYHLNPKEGLGAQRLFRHSILGPFMATIPLWVPVFNDYSLSFTVEGFKTFLDISKLHLGVMALSIPLAALVSRLHRTKQTAEQIRVTEQDNQVKLYLAHYQHFVDHVNNHVDYKNTELGEGEKHPHVAVKRLYKSIYPNASLTKGITFEGDVYFNQIQKIFSILLKYYESIADAAVEIEGEESLNSKPINGSFKELIIRFEVILRELYYYLCISNALGSEDFIQMDRYTTALDEIKSKINNAAELYITLVDFSATEENKVKLIFRSKLVRSQLQNIHNQLDSLKLKSAEIDQCISESLESNPRKSTPTP